MLSFFLGNLEKELLKDLLGQYLRQVDSLDLDKDDAARESLTSLQIV